MSNNPRTFGPFEKNRESALSFARYLRENPTMAQAFGFADKARLDKLELMAEDLPGPDDPKDETLCVACAKRRLFNGESGEPFCPLCGRTEGAAKIAVLDVLMERRRQRRWHWLMGEREVNYDNLPMPHVRYCDACRDIVFCLPEAGAWVCTPCRSKERTASEVAETDAARRSQAPTSVSDPVPADGELREVVGWSALAAAVMSLIALADLPYGYYMFLRWVVSGASLLACWWLWLRRWKPAVVALVLLALLFNPVVRVHLDKETWRILNIIAALGLGAVSALALSRRRST